MRHYFLFTLLAMIFLILAGCATKPPPKPAPEENGLVIEKLPEDLDGFSIKEVMQMDTTLQQDFQRSVTLFNEEKYTEAISILTQVVEQKPRFTAPYINLAIAYQRIDKPDQAETYLKEALKLIPGHPVACNQYGLLYRKTGRFAEARSVYEQSLTLFPNYYPVHRNLGILCDLYLGDLPCALEHYEIYSKAIPKDEQVKLWIVDLNGRMEQN